MKKECTIIIRVDKDLKNTIVKKSKKIGISVSDYTRQLYIYGDIKVVSEQTVKDLRGLSININQIAKKLNGGSITSDAVILELQNIITDLKKINLR